MTGPTSSATRVSDLVAEAWAAVSRGAFDEAGRLSRRVLRTTEDAQAYHVLALSRRHRGELGKAAEFLERAIALDPNALACSDLAVLFYERGEWARAVRACERCLELRPDDPVALQCLADSLHRLGRFGRATAIARRWAAIATDSAREEATCLLVRSLLRDNRLEEAKAEALAYLKERPTAGDILLLLANAFQAQKRFEAGLHYVKLAAERLPESGPVQAMLAWAYWTVGDSENAMRLRKQSIEALPAGHPALGTMNWLCLHDPEQTAASLLRTHQRRPAVNREPRPALPAHGPAPGERLRIGYLSGEFVSSAAYSFLITWLSEHDADAVETFYYASRPWADPYTQHFRELADHWSEVFQRSDEEVARQIEADRIDILVDLSGSFQYNRLGVFELRPAPVQVTFPNYPGTTGVDQIDYILTDRWTTPAGSESEYAERPFRLPSGYLVYKAEEIEVPPSPADRNGFITFGFFQRPGKMHAVAWDAVAAVLRQVPDSRLLVHFGSTELDEPRHPQRRRLESILGARGVTADRLLYRGHRSGLDHLAAVGEADIALDAFPYNGQTTTCDCLWMGVPVITVRGNSHVSRVGQGLLERAGVESFAAPTVEGYVAEAVRLAGDRAELGRLRRTLRSRMKAGSLTDGARLAREVEAAYRVMWSSARRAHRAAP